jgi:basic amino acid/polyamine antiporter, APA family
VVVGVVGVLVLAVVVAVVRQLGAARLAISPAPLRAALDAADAGALQTLLLIAVVVGCGFSLVSVLRGLPAGGVPHVRVMIAAGIVTAGGAFVIPATVALASAAVLLLGDSAFRLVAARHRTGG